MSLKATNPGKATAGAAAFPGLRRRLRSGATGALYLGPLLVLVTLILVIPIIVVIRDSLLDGITGSFTTSAWTELFTKSLNRKAIITSIELAALSATVAVAVAMPVAWWVSRMKSSGQTAWVGLANVAANFSSIGLAFAYAITLGASGLVTVLLGDLGIHGLNPAPDSIWALLIAYSYFNVPLAVLLVLPAQKVISDDWMDAAKMEGAKMGQFWRRIGIPVLTPFGAMTWILMFTWSIGQFSVAYAMAGGAGSTISLMTLSINYSLTSDINGLASASSMSILLLLLSISVMPLYVVISKRSRRWLP